MWVSNHTSMIDYIILTAYSPFAVIMQLHAGWVRAARPETKSFAALLCPVMGIVEPLCCQEVLTLPTPPKDTVMLCSSIAIARKPSSKS